MVDAARGTRGVAGAQLAGAGLGGCLMVLVKREAVAALRENLKKLEAELEGISPTVLVCWPIAGAGLLFGANGPGSGWS